MCILVSTPVQESCCEFPLVFSSQPPTVSQSLPGLSIAIVPIMHKKPPRYCTCLSASNSNGLGNLVVFLNLSFATGPVNSTRDVNAQIK